uniref:Uncharacterized protein n=1 Tax=Physcomitrium patens TaxID=3218 RepID=A9SNZ0_PHYPA|nr:hypothetical protein PHYPA_019564 [Physcomitrium patens]
MLHVARSKSQLFQGSGYKPSAMQRQIAIADEGLLEFHIERLPIRLSFNSADIHGCAFVGYHNAQDSTKATGSFSKPDCAWATWISSSATGSLASQHSESSAVTQLQLVAVQSALAMRQLAFTWHRPASVLSQLEATELLFIYVLREL